MAPTLRISDARIDQFIEEDIPYIDLTTHILGIADEQASIEYYTREACVLCGTEEVLRILEKLQLQVEYALPSGTQLKAQQPFLRASGRAEDIHAAWKVCLNIFDHLSAIATHTKVMVDEAHRANEHCEILTTRKSLPGAKDLLTKAVMTGGAYPHRLGLSETVLIFAEHIAFLGGIEELCKKLPEIRAHCVEKKVFVEASIQDVACLAKAGVDGIQFDKAQPEEIAHAVQSLKTIDQHITLIAAGGINEKNAYAYAKSGVDGIATTAPFSARPCDMSVHITKNS